MIGNAIGWFFDLIGKLWNGFWNVLGKLLGLVVFTIACGIAAVAVLKLGSPDSREAWLYFKGGACIGFILGALRLIINEVAVPLVHEQEARARMEARRQLELDLAKSRVAARQESLSNRLKHLN